MATSRQIQKWKNKYDDVYKVPVLEFEFYFRPLGREEYRQVIIQDLPIGDFQEAICAAAMLEPADFDFGHGRAGFAETLCDLILDASGLHMGQAQQILNEFREEMMVFDNQVDCLIKEAFPEYKIEDIGNWTVPKTMWHAARAEYVLQVLRGIPIIPIDQQAQAILAQQKGQQPPQQPQPQKQPMMSPQERAMNSPLARPEEPPAPRRPVERGNGPQRSQLSEEETMRMLTQSMASHPQGGQQIDPARENNPAGDMFPELSWFTSEEQLKGEFD
ncbi:hypothetical protein GZH47_32690 (plasmid) [Paenibacillus rhizovicinus]|uniref:Uncharacterized protein n=1 Tax=Paenibacillus rhizovicinus TaxID=2704463 RepID=A0A6C0PAV7_9BACL|nr:hypothetical protein [Paenibacillus rhizovicinus]QHW35658.1 hypothetical protein GZH47_32690 [Paenibacillus rhizovicinus]